LTRPLPILTSTRHESAPGHAQFPVVRRRQRQPQPDGALLIEDADNQPFLSMASLWEMAIKISLGKLMLSEPFDTLIPQQMRLNGIRLLPIELAHVAVVATLPYHHAILLTGCSLPRAWLSGFPL